MNRRSLRSMLVLVALAAVAYFGVSYHQRRLVQQYEDECACRTGGSRSDMG